MAPKGNDAQKTTSAKAGPRPPAKAPPVTLRAASAAPKADPKARAASAAGSGPQQRIRVDTTAFDEVVNQARREWRGLPSSPRLRQEAAQRFADNLVQRHEELKQQEQERERTASRRPHAAQAAQGRSKTPRAASAAKGGGKGRRSDDDKPRRTFAMDDIFNSDIGRHEGNANHMLCAVQAALGGVSGVCTMNERRHCAKDETIIGLGKHLSFIFRHAHLCHPEDASLSIGELLSYNPFNRQLVHIKRDHRSAGPGNENPLLGGRLQRHDIPERQREYWESAKFLMPFVHALLFNDKARYEVAFIPKDKFRTATLPEDDMWVSLTNFDAASAALQGLKSAGACYIRAISGHSFEITKKVGRTFDFTDPENEHLYLVHGTKERAVNSILRDGLLPGGLVKGSRNHVHFIKRHLLGIYPNDVRENADTLVIVKASELSAQADEIEVSKRDYVLVKSAVPPSAFIGIWSVARRCWFYAPSNSDMDLLLDASRSWETNDLRLHLSYFNAFYAYRAENPGSDYSDNSTHMRKALDTRVASSMVDPGIFRRTGHPEEAEVWQLKQERALQAPADEDVQKSLDKLKALINVKFQHLTEENKAQANKVLDSLYKETRAANKASDTASAVKDESNKGEKASSSAASAARQRSRSPIQRRLKQTNPRAREEIEAAKAASQKRTKPYFEQPVASDVNGMCCTKCVNPAVFLCQNCSGTYCIDHIHNEVKCLCSMAYLVSSIPEEALPVAFEETDELQEMKENTAYAVHRVFLRRQPTCLTTGSLHTLR